MKYAFPFIAIVLSLLTLPSCGSRKSGPITASQGKTALREKAFPRFEHEALEPDRMEARVPEPVTHAAPVNEELYEFVEEWRGTPHRMGGNTRKGVDCSGFVLQVYQAVYNTSFLGRRAEDIFAESKPVPEEELREGDLVFFKIYSRRIDHVGVYLRDGDFAHASSSRGVMISNLNEDYYRKRFFM